MIAASSRVEFAAKVSDELVTEASPSIASVETESVRVLLRRLPRREARSTEDASVRYFVGNRVD